MAPTQHKEPANSRYLVSVDDVAFETRRQQNLHTWVFNTLYESRYINDKSIEMGANDRILDVGTGSGIWLLGVSKEVPDGTQLVGVDISDKTLPKIHPPNVRFEIASVLGLPEEWKDSFDFVHERFLTAALSLSDWFIAAQEMFRVLKPGKAIQLTECAVLGFVSDSDGPELRGMLDISKKICESRGVLLDCPRHLNEVLQRAGFVDIVERKLAVPLDESAGELRIPGKLGFMDGMRNVGRIALDLGLVGSPKEWDEYIDRLDKEWDNLEGFSMTCHMFCAKKPE